ncbi:MAG TPA: hypothetical protein VGG36_05065 [Rhizomicrobium sp.]|jgi:hypothetical protein
MKRLGYVAVGVLVLAGCQKKTETTPQTVPYNIEISTKDLMKHAIDPAADIVWAASGYVVDEKGTTDLSPKTKEGWTIVENNAAIVAELSNTLMLPGRSPGEPQWNAYANRLHDTAMAAMRAAQHQDKAGLLHTGSDIFLACTGCHKRYVLGEK